MNTNTKASRQVSRSGSWATFALAGVLSCVAPVAEASLTAYSPGGANLVRLQNGPLDITLTADGNLLGTMLAGAANPAALINTIISSSGGGIADAFYGTWTLTPGDFSIDGRANYFGAKAFVNYLNTTTYGGSNQWRLPGITDTGLAGCDDFGYSGTDCGYNVAPASGELARLYYSELGRTAGFDTLGLPNDGSGYGIFANDGVQTSSGAVGPFSNVRSDAYWSGVDAGGLAWLFAANDGAQGLESKQEQRYAWAVTSGQVSPVPVPAAIWLFGSGLLGLAGLRRNRPA
jgi:hypothetical protein